MMDELDLTWEDSPAEAYLRGLQPGDQVSLGQFLLWFSEGQQEEAEETARTMEKRGIRLDVSKYQPASNAGAMGKRLALEEQLLLEGRLDTLPPEDVLSMTLGEYGEASPFGKNRAQELWNQAKEGNEEAQRALVEGSLPLVRDLAFSFVGKGVLLQDLMQEGSLALWELIAEREAEDFLTALDWSVRGALARAVALQAIEDQAGQSIRKDMTRYGKAVRTLQKTLGRTPSNEELAAELHKTPEETAGLARLIRDAGRALKPAPQAKDPDAERNVEDSAYFALRTRVEELLNTLDEDGRRILTLRFGLDGKPARSTEEIQEETGLSEAEVLRLEGAALASLREPKQGN